MKHIAELTQMPKEFEGNTVIERLFETTAVESLSKSEKIEYISFMTTERDRRNQEAFALEKSHNEGLQEGLQQGLQRGLEQGLEKGLQKGRLEMSQLIKNLRLSGMSDAKIAQMAGISEEEVKAI